MQIENPKTETMNVSNTDNHMKIIKRNEKIRKRFYYFVDQKNFSSEYALELLSDEFLPLEKQTIWLIISKTGHYKNL